jgi:hypothetical protein
LNTGSEIARVQDIDFNGLTIGSRLLLGYDDTLFFAPDFSYIPWREYKIAGWGSVQMSNKMKLGFFWI